MFGTKLQNKTLSGVYSTPQHEWKQNLFPVLISVKSITYYFLELNILEKELKKYHFFAERESSL